MLHLEITMSNEPENKQISFIYMDEHSCKTYFSFTSDVYELIFDILNKGLLDTLMKSNPTKLQIKDPTGLGPLSRGYISERSSDIGALTLEENRFYNDFVKHCLLQNDSFVSETCEERYFRFSETYDRASLESFLTYNKKTVYHIIERFPEFESILEQSGQLPSILYSSYSSSNKTGSYKSGYLFPHFSNLKDFIVCYLLQLLVNNKTVYTCKVCGALFVPQNRSDTLCCDRISPKDKKRSCKKYNSEKKWYEDLKQNDALKLARNIYQKRQMNYRRNPDIEEYENSFKDFKSQNKKWKLDIKEHPERVEIVENYMTWLKNEDKKKV